MLVASDFKQHVTVPTHNAGHTLDLLISNNSDDFISSVSVNEDLPSDHLAVKCLINVARPPAPRKIFRSRKIRSIDMLAFKSDVLDSPLLTNPADDLDSLVLQYDSVLLALLDNHAPEVERYVVLRPHSPWFNESLREAKQKKRRLERKWRKSGLSVDKELYLDQCTIYTDLLISAKSDYHRSELSQCEPRDLFRVIDKLCHASHVKKLPSFDNPKDLADKFANFFEDKIANLRQPVVTSLHRSD